jgi:DNA invertase Pin-like site-specific DNA recombinase
VGPPCAPTRGNADGRSPSKSRTSVQERRSARSEELLVAARRREIDLVVVWRLDRWGRSLVDLVNTLQELSSLKVGFVSLSEALDLTTPSGRALAGMLAVFAEFERDVLRDRVKADIAQARKEGKPHGRPPSAALHVDRIKELFSTGSSKRELPNSWGSAGRRCGGSSRCNRDFPGSGNLGYLSHHIAGRVYLLDVH